MNRRWKMVAMVLAGAVAAGASDYRAKREAAQAAATQKAANAPVPKDAYAVTGNIPIGGEGNAWENFAVDADGKLLYVVRQRKTLVFDIATGKSTAEIAGGQGATCIALDPDVGRGFVTNREGTVSIFDLKTNQPLGTIPVGDEPGAIAYDSFTKKILVCCVGKIAILAPGVDPVAGKPERSIDLQGKADGIIVDGQGMAYMSIRERDEIDVIDTRIMKIVTVWPLGGRGKPIGLSMDRQRSRLFMACHNKLIVMSATDGHILDDMALSQQSTGTAFADGKVFAAGSAEGILTIAAQNDEGKFVPVQSLLLGGSLHAPVANPKTGAIYLPMIDMQNHQPVKGSFKIEIVEKSKPAAAGTP